MPIPLLLVWGTSWGCSATEAVRLGNNTADDGGAPGFDPHGDAATDGDSSANLLMCVGTECPAPFTTCPSSGLGYKCGVDLSRDPNNCGTCGNKCLNYKTLYMNSRCVDGQCELECYNDISLPGPRDMRNCNSAVDDGCETDVFSDPQNCGFCGKVCGAGQPCINRRCGCPTGRIPCPGPSGSIECVDPQTDDGNCGGCGKTCTTAPSGACNPMPANTRYGCGGGQCGKIKCANNSADCNRDVGTLGCSSDGCEVDDVQTDRNNCGGCGRVCAPNEDCIDEGNGYECAVPCTRFGKSKCPGGCYDLLNDPGHCGNCEDPCRNAGPNEVRSCTKGRCEFECVVGFADCNGDVSDGCEVNLKSHPGNCGRCGKSCDVAGGQPCVDGRCLMIGCDGGAPVQ